jgi:hypothetical protein
LTDYSGNDLQYTIDTRDCRSDLQRDGCCATKLMRRYIQVGTVAHSGFCLILDAR